MRSEKEIADKLAFLEGQLANGNDPGAVREINRLKWLLGIGFDRVHVPKPAGRVT